jgi:hypothetical protein
MLRDGRHQTAGRWLRARGAGGARAAIVEVETRIGNRGEPPAAILLETACQQLANGPWVVSGNTSQIGSVLRTFASVSLTSSPSKARRPVSIS